MNCKFCDSPATLSIKDDAPSFEKRGPGFEGTYTEALCANHRAAREWQADLMRKDCEDVEHGYMPIFPIRKR